MTRFITRALLSLTASIVLVSFLVPTAVANPGESPAPETAYDVPADGKRAKGKPLWALVFAGGALYSPDYPASDESHFKGIGFPYLIYRGKIFRLGDGSVARAVALENDRYELDLSLDGSFNADSKDNQARRGMPDLDYMGEIGPQLIVTLGKYNYSGREHANLKLKLQSRAVFSSDFRSLDDRGFVFEPVLAYRHRKFRESGFDLYASLAPAWATERLMDYFYEVTPLYATAARPAFDARGGYLGTELTAGVSFNPTRRVRLHVGGQFGFYEGAVNDQSPLFREKLTWRVGFGFLWSLWQSEELVSN